MTGEQHLLRSERTYEWEYDGEPECEGALRWKVLISSGRTPTSGISMGLLEVPPGTSLEPHHHHPQEVYYVTEGRAEVYVHGRWLSVERGDVIYWPGDFPHGIRNRGEELCSVVWMFPTDSYDDITYVDDRETGMAAGPPPPPSPLAMQPDPLGHRDAEALAQLP